MSRKASYNIDYCNGYDTYDDDYGDYYNDLEEEIDETFDMSTHETVKHGLWRCSICTFDNEENMTACDICGVIRSPMVNTGSSDDKKTVGGMCKDLGVSVMAKSLCPSLPQQIPGKSVIHQHQNDDIMMEEGNKFDKLGFTQGRFHDFIKDFSTHNHYHINIAPFKFDVPSPDDLVTNGIRSSKMVSKANLPSNIPSSNKKLNRPLIEKFNGDHMGDNSISLANSGKQVCAEELHYSSLPIIQDADNASVYEIHGSLVKVDEPADVANGFNGMSLNDKSDFSKIPARKSMTLAHYKPEEWMLPLQSDDMLAQLNLAIVGHVDSGKSTLSGRLLHLLGQISQKQMHKYAKEAKSQGKGSFAYAWALDDSAEERERGITMTVSVAYFDSKKYHVVILDSPGHKDFVPNMISGATQADIAVLVIDASIGSFETGMDSIGGQTREHAQLIRNFGVDKIIVAVNKMDVVEYSKERFDFIQVNVGSFLRSCGFKDSFVSWVPLSALENQNLVAPTSDVRLLSWYKGSCFLDVIDSLQLPTRDFWKPLLMPICDVIKSRSLGHMLACGKLEAGAIRSGVKVVVMPYGDVGTVRSIERDSQPCSIARAGDNVYVTLHGIDSSRMISGGVLCHPDFLVSTANHLELKILILDITTPIINGTQLEFHVHHAKEAASVVKILSLLNPKTGKETKKAPRFLLTKQSALVEVILNLPLCVEEFSKCKVLGRVFLRASGRTVAVGVVSRIIQ